MTPDYLATPDQKRAWRELRAQRESTVRVPWHDHVTAPALTAILKLTGLYETGRQNALNPRRVHQAFSLQRLPAAFDGFRILWMSDFHIDPHPQLARAIVKLIEGERFDLCVLGGDYRYLVAGPSDAVYPPMSEIIAAVDAEHKVCLLGNHDFAEHADWLAGRGFHPLINEGVLIERAREPEAGSDPGSGHRQAIWIAGTDEAFFYKTHDLEASLAGRPDGACTVLVTHTPDIIPESAAAQVDLYLCGHTHGGQIRLPLIGPLANHAPYDWACLGRWNYNGLQGYTSPGTGSSLVPVRFNCPGEVTVVELRLPASDGS